jgi:hypothetical protein
MTECTSEEKNDGLSHFAFAERNYEEVECIYGNTIANQPYEQAWCGLKEKPLLRQSAERRFDLMPSVEDDGLYESACFQSTE